MTTKDTTKEEVKEKAVKTTAVKKAVARYIEAVGRRKTSTARVRITEGSKESVVVNDKDVSTYFPTLELQKIVSEAIEKSKVAGKFAITVKVVGGGIHSQAEALRHGLSRALVTFDEETRKRLKKLGFLKRDPRMKERRKFGLKKARKAPQWSKR
ncbi:MAG: 30S ribosomal protein S9 [Minisyncoccia bacterium]